jgi:hypothetical protein
MLAEIAPVLHKKLVAPETVSVVEAPAQIEVDEALTFILGSTLTVIVFEILAEQPPELVPVQE